MQGFLVDGLAEGVLTTAGDEGVGVFVQGFVERTAEEEAELLTTAEEDEDGVVAGWTAEEEAEGTAGEDDWTADEEAAGITLELPEIAGADDGTIAEELEMAG